MIIHNYYFLINCNKKLPHKLMYSSLIYFYLTLTLLFSNSGSTEIKYYINLVCPEFIHSNFLIKKLNIIVNNTGIPTIKRVLCQRISQIKKPTEHPFKNRVKAKKHR